MNLTIDVGREEDGRWIAEALDRIRVLQGDRDLERLLTEGFSAEPDRRPPLHSAPSYNAIQEKPMKPFVAALFLCALALFAIAAPADNDGWISMFDGKTLTGWKANEHPESWTVRDGAITGDGEASHLFWMERECENCEFKAEVKISHGGNSGMYFRTAFGPGFPKGYEAQVNSSHTDPVRTGSLYNFHKILETLIPDDTWGTQHIIAQGTHIIIKVNDKVVTDYVESTNRYTKGYLALQQHNKGSVVQFRNLMFRPLPAN